ncbi:hypothetical protein FN846DRAFT_905164 [Sphaerosporella brunnea]|uniref:Fungal-type protein kinase domain-containing protein n=1 Tax=Sphaerosporella brunnea TaxID=1250544 RepID=A0A5J5F2B3_9PEZI|nr:hypothetical protein FN846DRAFT_905164 [Sphaerosporella brunnea]
MYRPHSIKGSDSDGTSTEWILKDSWQWKTKRQSEGELLVHCSCLGSVGVAKASRYELVEDVHGIFMDGILESAHPLSIWWKLNKRPCPYNEQSVSKGKDRCCKRSRTISSAMPPSTHSLHSSTRSATCTSLLRNSASIDATASASAEAGSVKSERNPARLWSNIAAPMPAHIHRSYEYVLIDGAKVHTKIANLLHHRMILECGSSVIRNADCTSGHYLLLCLQDAFRGHRELLTKAGILQRDISCKNILLADATREDRYSAFLIDVHLAVLTVEPQATEEKSTPTPHDPASKHTGTFEFMSIDMLLVQPGFVHCYYDELQSVKEPKDSRKLKYTDISVETLFVVVMEKFDIAWGYAVRKVAVSLRAVLWPAGTLVDRTWVNREDIRAELYEKVISVLWDGVRIARKELASQD